MKDFTHPSGAFSLAIPDDWEQSQGRSALAIFKSYDGFGAINISSLRLSSAAPTSASELLREAVGEAPFDGEIRSVVRGDGAGAAAAEYRRGEFWWRAWMIVNSRRAAYITYNCRIASKGREDSDVDRIVASLRLAAP